MMLSQSVVHSSQLSMCLLASLLLFPGCGGSDYPVALASGNVTCEGKAVPGAWVFFEPLAGAEKSALVGKQGFGIADGDGKFVISTYGTSDGAVIGKHKVHVLAPKSDVVPGFKCPCEFDSEKEPILVEVKEGKNEYKLVLPVSKAVASGGKSSKPLSLDDKEAMMEAQQEELANKAKARSK